MKTYVILFLFCMFLFHSYGQQIVSESYLEKMKLIDVYNPIMANRQEIKLKDEPISIRGKGNAQNYFIHCCACVHFSAPEEPYVSILETQYLAQYSIRPIYCINRESWITK